MSNKSKIQGIEQGRAKTAYDCVVKAKEDIEQKIREDNKDESDEKLKEKIDKKQKEYKSYAKKIPMMIKTNGLGATLAFIKSKRKKTYDYIYDNIVEWLIQKDPKKLLELKPNEELMDRVISINSPEYRAVTIEVLAFLSWLRRFAEGLIEGDDS